MFTRFAIATRAVCSPEPRPEQWIVVENGTIAALERSEPRGLAQLRAPLGVACPGFFDSHLHLLLAGSSLAQLDLSDARSRGEIEQLIASAHQSLPPDRWLLARGWNEANLIAEPESHRTPDAQWLLAAGDRPCIAWRSDLHSCVVNQPVLDLLATELAGRSEDECPRHDGRPIGILREGAAWKVLIPRLPAPTTDELDRGLTAAQRLLLANGITSVGSMEYADWVDRVLLPRRDTLSPRVHLTMLDREWPVDVAAVARRAREATPRLRFVGCKSFADGTLGSRTAWMQAPYADGDGLECGTPLELTADGRLAEWMALVAAAGLSPSVHAIGDAALTAVLDAADTAELGRHVLRIEHAQTVAPEDIARLARHIVSMQPLHKADDARIAHARLGPERLNRFFPFRRIADSGARLAFGSDWPIAPPNPIEAMRTAITGRTVDGDRFQPEQSLSPLEALRATTIDAARSLRAHDDLGHLTPGAGADITSLDRDPLSCDWLNDPPHVLATIVGGELAFPSA